MKKHSIPTDDLFTLTKGFAGKFSVKTSDVHFTLEGSAKLAEQVAAMIEKAQPLFQFPHRFPLDSGKGAPNFLSSCSPNHFSRPQARHCQKAIF
jgi:hypothetical protein